MFRMLRMKSCSEWSSNVILCLAGNENLGVVGKCLRKYLRLVAKVNRVGLIEPITTGLVGSTDEATVRDSTKSFST
jgi:hypothetical protein